MWQSIFCFFTNNFSNVSIICSGLPQSVLLITPSSRSGSEMEAGPEEHSLFRAGIKTREGHAFFMVYLCCQDCLHKSGR